ncbi:MAG TPA: hypothetical protein P5555_05530 [Candidatus Paceibacterota bacterium]|nr:hypothetical protein [Verrucomicrobiota bacterium]HRZ44631.1 hypothetical protein [Candidatus Paceibacterota bacterium]
MADCHPSFIDYLGALNLTDTQEGKLRTSRDALLTRISSRFKDEGRGVPEYESQGSYAINTQNRPISDDFDLDHGVYLVHWGDNEPVAVDEAFRLVSEAVQGQTTIPLPHKDTCVRVQYKAAADGTPAHHIDLAIYRKRTDGSRLYAHRVSGWQPSDQKGFISHYKAKSNDQIRALVRLFKGWSDYQGTKGGEKMPSGFHFTVCILDCSALSPDRHDRAFVLTAEGIRDRLSAYRSGTGNPVRRPVIPKDNIFENYSPGRLDHLIKKLNEISIQGRRALNEGDPGAAQRIWRDLFGDRFQAPEPSDLSEAKKPWSAPAVIGTSGKAA